MSGLYSTHRQMILGALVFSLASLSFVANLLFYGVGLGSNIFLFIIPLVVFILLLGLLRIGSLGKMPISLTLAAVVFSFLFMTYSSVLLQVINFFTILALLMLLLTSYLPNGFKGSTLYAVASEFFRVPIKLLLSLFNLNNEESLHKQLFLKRKNERDSRLVSPELIRGALITLPILIIVILLLSSADSVFANIFSFNLPTLNISDELIGRTFFFLFILISLLAVSKYVLTGKLKPIEKSPEHTGAGHTEVTILTASLTAILGLFIAIQVVYLFGGRNIVLDQNITFAEYARKGFFELLAVSTIVYGVISVSSYFIKEKIALNKLNFIQLLLIVEVFVLIASALKRLALYQEEFGLTVSRILGYSVMLAIAVLFAFLAIKIYFKKSASWMLPIYGTVALATVFALNIINIESYVAKSNVDRFLNGKKIDETYLFNLSTDATDAKIRYIESEEVQIFFRKEIKNADIGYSLGCSRDFSKDWREMTLSRANCEDAVESLIMRTR
jgi:hypothetical protein